MNITVTQKDIDESSGYVSNDNCPIARAVKRITHKEVSVAADYFRVRRGNKWEHYTLPYSISDDWADNMIPISFIATRDSNYDYIDK